MREIKKVYLELLDQINDHDYAYYVLDSPTISDQEYDGLYARLREIEERYPEIQEEDSPTRRVGAGPLAHFPKVTREHRMYSLDNTYSLEQFTAFFNRVEQGLGGASFALVIEPKIDGLAIECTYLNGQLALGATRGNGVIGEDVTQNIKTIRSIPLSVKPWSKIPKVILRGEVYIEKSDLKRVNHERVAQDLEPFKNPRNAAAGSLRLLDASITAERPLKVIFYEILLHPEVSQQHQTFELFRTLRIPTHENVSVIEAADKLQTIAENWMQQRNQLEYEIDGLVAKVNDFSQRRSLGFTSKYPRWAIAFKFETEKAYTCIEGIDFQVGRTGKITPVAILKPVFLSGTLVSRASLHNFDEVARKDIHMGDEVLIEKAGEIIPQVLEVVSSPSNAKRGEKVVAPERCPACDSLLRLKEGSEIILYCPNTSCSAQIREKLIYFCSRNAANIEKLGPAMIDKLLEAKLIADAADIFKLKVDGLKDLPGLGDKSSENIIASIKKARDNMSLAAFITALGIPLVGGTAAEKIASKLGNLEALLNTIDQGIAEQLSEVDGIGEKMVGALVTYFSDEANRQLIVKFLKMNISPKQNIEERGSALSGMSICVSGTLSRPRDQFKKLIQDNGGSFVSSVSKKTSYLLAGENIGQSKLDNANKFNVKIINEADFMALIQPE